jgi:hypothetical protein
MLIEFLEIYYLIDFMKFISQNMILGLLVNLLIKVDILLR